MLRTEREKGMEAGREGMSTRKNQASRRTQNPLSLHIHTMLVTFAKMGAKYLRTAERK